MNAPLKSLGDTIFDAKGKTVGFIDASHFNHVEARRIAARIVKCVNAHDHLISALQRTRHALSLAWSQKPVRDVAETLAEADAALAKAEAQ